MNRKKYRQATAVLFMVICLLWAYCSCQTVNSHSVPSQVLLQKVLSGGSLFGDRTAQRSLPEDDIFKITPEMRDFLKRNIPSGNNYSKLRKLIETVIDKSFLGWNYNAYKTYSASESFRQREGNCISYAIMMTALGRELGLKMHFNEVHITPTWDIQAEQTAVLFRHVNVLSRAGGKRMVLDLDIEEYDSSYPQYRISDTAAEAHYYNNRGTDYLKINDMENAFLYFRKALALQPEQAFIWGNIGVLYLRYGHYAEAEAAFLHAIELDPYEVTAISNLQRLYVMQNNTELADYYRKEAESSRMKNPYYRYYLAKKLLDENQPDMALKHIKWSISKYKKEHRFYFLAAKIYARLGMSNDAEKNLEQAAELAENENSRLLYQSKIARLREISRKK